MQNGKHQMDFLSPDELESEFEISKACQAKMRLKKNRSNPKRSIPFYRIAGRIAYKRSEIVEWLNKQKEN